VLKPSGDTETPAPRISRLFSAKTLAKRMRCQYPDLTVQSHAQGGLRQVAMRPDPPLDLTL